MSKTQNGVSAPLIGYGRIILEGSEVEPYVLRDFDGVALFEFVSGQFRIEKLEGEANVQE